jgi:hypothetical protein
MLPTKFRIIWPSGFRGEEFYKSENQKQESPVVEFMFMIVCFLKNKKTKKLCGKGDNSNLNIDTMN